MSLSAQDTQLEDDSEFVPLNTLVGGYPLSQEAIRQWGERNVQTEESATDAEKIRQYLRAIVFWATRKFGGYCNIEVYGDDVEILDHKIILRTQRGTWNGGYHGIKPEYIPQYIEAPEDKFLKGILEEEFRELRDLLVYFIVI